MISHTPIKIISGGQTGADQAALEWARENGFATGGWMPKGWRTDEGDRPDFKDLYGMKEHADRYYPARTKANVYDADATFIFGNLDSPGCRLTAKACKFMHKPYLGVVWPNDPLSWFDTQLDMQRLLTNVTVLNIAGNRSKSNPGIEDGLKNFLTRMFNEQ